MEKISDSFIIMAFLCLIILPLLSMPNSLNNIYLYIVGVILFFVFLITSIIIKIIFWRCPKCGSLLPLRKFIVEFCSVCGEKLD